MNLQLDHPNGFNDDYDQLSLEQAMTNVRLLIDMCSATRTAATLEPIGNGDCDDCTNTRILVRYGIFEICRGCASRRLTAGAPIAR